MGQPLGTQRAREFDESLEAKAADSGFRTRREGVPVLRVGGREHRLERPQTTLGRSAACDIQVTSGLVSRRHACVTLSDRGIVVEDLGSRNGVYVNAERIVGSARLNAGDRIGIGDETFVLLEADEPEPGRHVDTVAAIPAQRSERDSFTDDETASATRSADVFQLLGHVVDKSLALGRGEEAEHLIATHLTAALNDAMSERKLPPDIARRRTRYAVKLASATGRAHWLDYAVRLYHALELVLPLSLVDEMYVLLRRVPGIDLHVLVAYTEALRVRALGLAPAERFVLQRLIGLERLAVWQTSTRPR